MDENSGKHQKCPLCEQPFTKIKICNQPFYVHTGTQLDKCVAIRDDQQWVKRIFYILEKLGKKPRGLTKDITNKDGNRVVFGEKLDG